MAWAFIAVGAIGLIAGYLFNAGALIFLSGSLFLLSFATNLVAGTHIFDSFFTCFALIFLLQFCYFCGAGLLLLRGIGKIVITRLLDISAGSHKSDGGL